MYCIECGQAQPVKEAQFCPFCGTALHHPGTPSPEAAGGPPSGDQSADPGATVAAPAAEGQGSLPVATVQGTETLADPINPLATPMATTLDPARWVPLHNRGEQLRARLRWAIRVAVVLLFAMAGAGAWWWATQPDQPMAEEGVEVERIEAPAPAPAPATAPASTPAPTPAR
jgi:hypothetical protein